MTFRNMAWCSEKCRRAVADDGATTQQIRRLNATIQSLQAEIRRQRNDHPELFPLLDRTFHP